MTKTYWNHKGAYTSDYEELQERLVPDIGRAPTQHGELLSSISRIYYDWYNNGGCNLELPRFQAALYTVRGWALEIDLQPVLNQRVFTGTCQLIDRLLRWSKAEDAERKFGLEFIHEKDLELLVDKIVMLVKAEDEKANKTRSEADIRKAKALLESDERLGYETANVIVNAPLALQQLSMTARIWALQWVLGETKSCTGDVAK